MKKYLLSAFLFFYTCALILNPLILTAQDSEPLLPEGYVQQDHVVFPVPYGTAEHHTDSIYNETWLWNQKTLSWDPPSQSYEGDWAPADADTLSNCSNSNLYLGNFTNWKGCYGSWSNPTFKLPCTNANMPWQNNPTGGRYEIITYPGGPDAFVPAINSIYPGGYRTCLIGKHQICSGGGTTDQLTYPLIISTDNQFFIYRYAVVLANVTDATHNTADKRPRFTLGVYDHTTGALLDATCGFADMYPGDGTAGWQSLNYNSCSGSSGSNGPLQYKDWTTVGIDLSGFTTIGQAVDIVFTVHGCGFSAHTGYAYISASCKAMQVETAGCEGSGIVTMTAPPGFQSYLWQGPYCAACPMPPPTYTVNPLTINAAQGAVTGNSFHLSLTAFNGCTVNNITNVIGFTSVAAGFTSDVMCALNSSTFTDISTSSNVTMPIVSRRWKFDATGTWTSLLTNPVTTYTYLTPGPHEVTVEAYSQDGCTDTYTQTINVDPAPAISNGTTTKSICSGENVAISLEFTDGNTATWTYTILSGTATIVKNPASSSGILINDAITNTGVVNTVVRYTVIPHSATGCNGASVDFIV
ncbi:MAG: PKD-like domain-containing protein, partial [bacterium]